MQLGEEKYLGTTSTGVDLYGTSMSIAMTESAQEKGLDFRVCVAKHPNGTREYLVIDMADSQPVKASPRAEDIMCWLDVCGFVSEPKQGE